MPQNMDESSFKHFIEHLTGMKENSKFKYKQGRSRTKQESIGHLKNKSQPKMKALIHKQTLKPKQNNNLLN